MPGQAVPVLQALLRHGLLREYAVLAARLLASDELPLVSLVRDAELVDLVPQETPTPGWRWQRDQPQPGSAPTRTIREALADPDALPQAATRPLTEFRDAVAALAGYDVPTLERHLLGTLAATSYRLDAWATSLTARRLAALRETTVRETTLLGGYGWLEGLRPEPMTPAPQQPDDEPGPLFLPASDPGFIRALAGPGHTAALLRNAHLAHGGGDGPYSIQLSSARVRAAQRCSTVSGGTGLGAHSATTSRALHETTPAAAATGPQTSRHSGGWRPAWPPKMRSSRRILLDGLGAGPRGGKSKRRCSGSTGRTVRRGTRRHWAARALDRALDAVADAVTAEASISSSAATSAGVFDLKDITSGDAPPSGLQHQRTPAAAPVTPRGAGVATPTAPCRSQRRAPASSSPWAAADAATRSWASCSAGDAGRADSHCGDRPGTSAPPPVPLASLGLTPLDLLRLSVDASGRDELASRATPVAGPGAEHARHPGDAGARRQARAGVTVWDLLGCLLGVHLVIRHGPLTARISSRRRNPVRGSTSTSTATGPRRRGLRQAGRLARPWIHRSRRGSKRLRGRACLDPGSRQLARRPPASERQCSLTRPLAGRSADGGCPAPDESGQRGGRGSSEGSRRSSAPVSSPPALRRPARRVTEAHRSWTPVLSRRRPLASQHGRCGWRG